MENRRKEPRIPVSFPVACKDLPARKEYFYTVCRDLSTHGIRVITNKFIKRGDFIKVNVNLIDRVVDLKAKVMWCNKERYADRYSAGLLFVEMGEHQKRHLSQFLTLAGGKTH